MPHGYKREYNDVLYFKKDHFCPDCKTKLEKVPVSKVVNSRSPEAKDFAFSIGGDTYAVGDIQFIWDEFECPNCKKHLTVNEMKEIEGVPLPKKPSKLRKILFYVFGMKLTKKSIFSIVYWVISCLILIVSKVLSFVQDRNPQDDIFLPGSSIDLFFTFVCFALQLFLHIFLFVCTRYWFYSKNKTVLGVLCMILLSTFSICAFLLYYYQFIALL